LRDTHLSVKPKFFTLTSILSLREGEEVATLIQNGFTEKMDDLKIENPLPSSKGEGRVRVPITTLAES
jgi:hypothetical protein